MPELHVVDPPLVAHKLPQMRRDTPSSERFRRLLTETSLLLTYEVTRELALRDVRITTPLTQTDQPELIAEPVVISIFQPIQNGCKIFLINTRNANVRNGESSI